VKKFCRIQIFLLSLLQFSQVNAEQVYTGVDCTWVPHTRLELAICSEPVLRALDTELTAAFKEALEHEVLDSQTIAEQRNQVARHCRREADDVFSVCLHDAELKSFEWVASKLGQLPGYVSATIDKRWRYDSSLTTRAADLKRQLVVAESRLQSTHSPELTVLTILSLLSVYEELQPHRGNTTASVDQLEVKLASGCNHSVYGKKWRKLLHANNRSCGNTQSLLTATNL